MYTIITFQSINELKEFQKIVADNMPIKSNRDNTKKSSDSDEKALYHTIKDFLFPKFNLGHFTKTTNLFNPKDAIKVEKVGQYYQVMVNNNLVKSDHLFLYQTIVTDCNKKQSIELQAKEISNNSQIIQSKREIDNTLEFLKKYYGKVFISKIAFDPDNIKETIIVISLNLKDEVYSNIINWKNNSLQTTIKSKNILTDKGGLPNEVSAPLSAFTCATVNYDIFSDFLNSSLEKILVIDIENQVLYPDKVLESTDRIALAESLCYLINIDEWGKYQIKAANKEKIVGFINQLKPKVSEPRNYGFIDGLFAKKWVENFLSKEFIYKIEEPEIDKDVIKFTIKTLTVDYLKKLIQLKISVLPEVNLNQPLNSDPIEFTIKPSYFAKIQKLNIQNLNFLMTNSLVDKILKYTKPAPGIEAITTMTQCFKHLINEDGWGKTIINSNDKRQITTIIDSLCPTKLPQNQTQSTL